MKIAIIPAQITTVEDRITANLSFTQILLLAIPLFITAVIFFLFPPMGGFAVYKVCISVILAGASSVLAIRIGDKLVLDLIKLRLHYLQRPNIYTFKKRSANETDYFEQLTIYRKKTITSKINMTDAELSSNFSSEKLLSSKRYKVAFKAKSGGLIVKVSTN